MRILDWFRRLFRRKEVEVEAEPAPITTEAARSEQAPDEPEEYMLPVEVDLLPVLDYMADMLSDKTLIPSYLRAEMAAARRLPAAAWAMARKPGEACLPHLLPVRDAAVELARQVAMAVLRETPTGKGRL